MRRFSLLFALVATHAVAQGSSPSSADTRAQSPSSAPVSAPPETASGAPAGPPASAQAQTDDDRWYSLYRGKKLGVQVDVGAPDGAGLMVLFRPYWWLRLDGGFAYNYMGSGLRGGITLMPVQWGVTPTLNFDFGHYFSGDLTKFVTPSTEGERALLSDAAYDFWSAQLGLEFGSQEGFLFYLRGGITHLSAGASSQNSTQILRERASSNFLARAGTDFTALLPSVSLGFVVYVL